MEISMSNGLSLALYKDSNSNFVERRWVVRRWNPRQRRAGPGKPWRFHTRLEADEWIRNTHPGLNREPAGIDDTPDLVALYS